jgi:hypothetical protein
MIMTVADQSTMIILVLYMTNKIQINHVKYAADVYSKIVT